MDNFFDSILKEIREGDDKAKGKLIDRAFDHFKAPVKIKRESSPLFGRKQTEEFEPEGLDFEHFSLLLNQLFFDPEAKEPFYIPRQWAIDLFKKFDRNQDHLVDKREFTWMWVKWIQVILKPKSALIVVDVQNDFITGSLAVCNCPAGHRGEEVVPVINSLLKNVNFDLIVYSYDWHPNDHISFYENYSKRKIVGRGGLPLDDTNTLDDLQVFDEVTFAGPPKADQKLWPRHCVQGSWGAKLHPDLIVRENNTVNIFKGTNSLVDSYSAFWDNNKLSETGLGKELKDTGITDAFVCGLAYDFCVGSTAEHANEYGFRTTLIDDASRGVDNAGISDMKNKLINKSAVIVDSSRVAAMVGGEERRPEHGFHLASFLK